MSDVFQSMKESITSKKARVGIIGMGYVGYPTAQIIAESGFHTTGIEVDAGRVEKINNGISYIQDTPSEAVKPLVEKGLLDATTDYSIIKDISVVLITVPTPLAKTGDPDLTYVINALDSISEYMHPGMLVVLESTTYPGTTEELFVPKFEEAGLKVGEDVFIGFSPERIDPGNATYGPKNTPKVVGGVTPNCTEISNLFYSQVIDTVIPVSSTTAAELVKLYENTFRAINIGLANEMAIISELLNVDIWEIINAAKTKPFGFMAFYPGPGLGGHCIPIDPSYLSWKMRSLQYKTRLIDISTEINTKMPEWVVTRTAEMLNEVAKPVKGSKILLVGLAYKNDIDDLRESPALDVFELLVRRGAEVRYHDPYCPTVMLEQGKVDSSELTPELVKQSDLVIITTGHKEKVDYSVILDNADLIFDTRNVTRDLLGHKGDNVVFL